MSNRTKLAIAIAVLLWSSAYVGIRAGLQSYSPEGLALLRYIIASICMGIVYFSRSKRYAMRWKDKLGLLCVGGFGIGLYNILLNYGELTVSSGEASFIISQSPLMAAIIAVLFLGERLDFMRILGFIVSILGIACITLSQSVDYTWNINVLAILLATIVGGLYSILQKPFLKHYHVIETTTYVIWGATLFLSVFASHLLHDLAHTNLSATLTVVYLGVFPAAVGYICWGYALAEISAARAMSFLYFSPFVATLLGWLLLNELPVMLALFGGILAIVGVWLVNHSYRKKLT